MTATPVLYHGTKHPYVVGDALVSGGMVKCCDRSEDAEPVDGCDCGCDPRHMIWAATLLEGAAQASGKKCGCPDWEDGRHRPRVFEVSLDDPEADPNGWGIGNLMGPSGRIIREVPASEWEAHRRR